MDDVKIKIGIYHFKDDDKNKELNLEGGEVVSLGLDALKNYFSSFDDDWISTEFSVKGVTIEGKFGLLLEGYRPVFQVYAVPQELYSLLITSEHSFLKKFFSEHALHEGKR